MSLPRRPAVVPALVLVAVIAAISGTACSGSNGSGATGTSGGTGVGATDPAGLPCCHGGFLYRCATETALEVCSDAAQDDTTDCTKTATACGGGNGPSTAGSDGGASATPSKTKKKTGEACVEVTECEGGQCLVFGSGTTGFCSNVCSSATQCPNNFRCQLVESIGNKVCAPLGDGKLGESCVYSIDCTSELCLSPASGGKGYCSATCNVPSDCGVNWQCAPVEGAAGKYCQR